MFAWRRNSIGCVWSRGRDRRGGRGEGEERGRGEEGGIIYYCMAGKIGGNRDLADMKNNHYIIIIILGILGGTLRIGG